MNNTPSCWPAYVTRGETGCNRFLLLVTGLGGRLSGSDIGIIAGALPYLEETFGLNASRLSIMVATARLWRMISTLLANFLTDLLGLKTLLISDGAVFVLSKPMSALVYCFGPSIHGQLPKEMGFPERFMQPKLTKRLGQA